MDKKMISPFKQALLDAQLKEWEDIPAEDEISIALSEEFQKKGMALIQQAKQTKIKKMRTAVRRIVLVAAIIAALAITALAFPVAREELVRFFAKDTEKHYEFTFDPELLASAPKKIEKVYKPSYIPEGFSEESVIAEEWVVYLWKSPSRGSIIFGQYPLSNESVRPQPDSKDTNIETFDWNGYYVLCICSNSNRMYFWTDNEYFYRLISSDTIPKEECKQVFCSIRENKNVILPK